MVVAMGGRQNVWWCWRQWVTKKQQDQTTQKRKEGDNKQLTEERKKWDIEWLIKKRKRKKEGGGGVWEPEKVAECKKFRTYSDILNNIPSSLEKSVGT